MSNPQDLDIIPSNNVLRRDESHTASSEVRSLRVYLNGEDVMIGLIPATRDDFEINRRQRRLRYVRAVYLFGIIPLPYVYYCQIWSDFYHSNFRQTLNVVFIKTLQLLKSLLFTFLKFHAIYINLRNILRFFNDITGLASKSPSFLKDIFTYICHSSDKMIGRHRDIIAHNNNIYYFLEFPEADKLSNWQTVKTIIFNHLASFYNLSLISSEDGPVWVTNEDSLIFKFSSIITSHYPSLYLGTRRWMAKSITLFLYLIYVTGHSSLLWAVSAHIFLGIMKEVQTNYVVIWKLLRNLYFSLYKSIL